MTVWGVVQELKGWQSVIGTVIGFAGLIFGALFNARLNRKRDDRLRNGEAVAIALSLYSEIKVLRNDIASMATGVGVWYLRRGLAGDDLPDHYRELFPLRQATIYASLAPKLGMLNPEILLPITKFYSDYETALGHLPKLYESEERILSYGVEWFLDPAVDAARDIEHALRRIEELGEINEPAPTPQYEKGVEALEWAAAYNPKDDD